MNSRLFPVEPCSAKDSLVRVHNLLRRMFFVAGVLSIGLGVAACSGDSATGSPTRNNLTLSQDLEADETEVSSPKEERVESETDAQQEEPVGSETPTTLTQAKNIDPSTTVKQSAQSKQSTSKNVKWVIPTPDNSVSRNPEITINNFSRLATSDLRSWTEAGTSYINWWHSDITSFIWPIGTEVGGPNELSHPFNRYQVSLDKDSINSLKSAYTSWSDNVPCLNGEHENFGSWQNRYELDEGKKLVLGWMESGADVATAPTPCFSSRAVTYAFPEDSSTEEGQHTYLHELYHALSSYLQDYCTNGGALNGDRFDKLRWVGEGTAHYFAYVVAAELNGTDDAIETMLRDAEGGARGGETLSSAESAAAALRLMVERGDLLEEDIMSARIFETCSWPDDWQASIPSVSYAMENWQEIESRSGKWVFKSSVLR
jgi:hypothetical protein